VTAVSEGSSFCFNPWVHVREAVSKAQAGRLDLVFDTQHKDARLMLGSASLQLEDLRHGRPIRVISLTDVIRDIRAAFERVSAT
jgi:hypothetical protein